MTAPGNGAVRVAAHEENDPGYWPAEIERTSEQMATAREQMVLLRKLEKVLVTKLANDIRASQPSMSKADSFDAAHVSPEYEQHVRKLAGSERSFLLWSGRYEAAKAQHESARTYAATQRAALYPRG